jgi:pimeloyl-ACP methyl ester carboxylesterase
VDVNGIQLRVVEEGPADGPPVLLLHGFPDSADLWRHQIPVLANAGFRVIAPDQRGFGQSDKPEGVDNYALPTLLGDVVGVLANLGVERTHIVGHDWGALVAWIFAMSFPDRVDRLAALSVGAPGGRSIDDIEQQEKSWYMLFFQHEGLAEEALQRDDWRLFRAWLRNAADVDRYLADLSRPGALTAGLNWYRANARPEIMFGGGRTGLPEVQAPTLGIWSTGDAYLTERQMTASADEVKGPWRYERIEGPSHWIPLDAPDRVNELLLDHLNGPGQPPRP